MRTEQPTQALSDSRRRSASPSSSSTKLANRCKGRDSLRRAKREAGQATAVLMPEILARIAHSTADSQADALGRSRFRLRAADALAGRAARRRCRRCDDLRHQERPRIARASIHASGAVSIAQRTRIVDALHDTRMSSPIRTSAATRARGSRTRRQRRSAHRDFAIRCSMKSRISSNGRRRSPARSIASSSTYRRKR